MERRGRRRRKSGHAWGGAAGGGERVLIHGEEGQEEVKEWACMGKRGRRRR